MAPSTAACISSISILHLPSIKGSTSNFFLGYCIIYSVMQRTDLPNISEKTSSDFKLDTVRHFWVRSFSRVTIQGSLCQYLTRILSSLMSADEIKEGLNILHLYKSQIHFASLQLILFPFICFVYLGQDRVTGTRCCFKILKTEIQYLPVDSIPTSRSCI